MFGSSDSKRWPYCYEPTLLRGFMKFLVFLFLLVMPMLVRADAVIFSGNDVKALKYNLDLFGRSKVMGLNVDPSAGAGISAPLGSIGMDYLTGNVYYKKTAPDTGWISISNAVEGSPNTFAAYNSSGILDDMPGWTYVDNATDYNGAIINKTVPNTTNNVSGIIVQSGLDAGQTITSFTGNMVQTSIGNSVASSVANFESFTANGYIGNSGTVTSYSGFHDGFFTDATAAVTYYGSFYANPSINSLAMSNYQGLNIDAQIGNGSAAHIDNYNGGTIQSDFYANADVDNATGIGIYENFNVGSTLDNYVYLNTNNNFDVATLGSLRGVAISSQIGQNAATAVNQLSEYSSNTNIYTGATVDSYNGITLNPWFHTGSDLNNGSSVNINGTYDVAALNYLSSINSFNQLGTSSATVISQYTDVNLNPNFGANLSITDYRGIQIRPNAQVGSQITNSAVLLDIGVNNTLPVGSNATGVSIDMGNITSPQQKVGLNVQNGSINGNSVIQSDDPWFGTAISTYNLGGLFHIMPGTPVAGGEFVFGANLAHSLYAEDDMGPDGTGLGLGFGVVGYVGQAAVVAGKTVDTLNMAVSGFGVPALSTGGTITDVVLYKALGALPQGGTLNVTNMYGFRAGVGLSLLSPTNVWGISIEDPAAENYFNKSLAIDVATKKVSGASVGLEIGNSKSIIADGMIKSKTSLVLEDPGAGTNIITFQAPTLAGDTTYTLPAADGTSGYALTTNGSGTLSWASIVDPNAFKQNGNSFAATAVLGTNDNNSLQIETNNTVVATFSTGGSMAVNGSAAPNTSAALDIQGTNGALLIPRLTTAQRNALTGTAGMQIYNTTTAQFECYVSSWAPCSATVSVNSNLTLTGGASISISTTIYAQTWRVQGNAAAVTLSTTPFGGTAPLDGARITLIGNHATNTVSLAFNDAAKGYVGPDITLGLYDSITVEYNSTLDRYILVSRSN